MLSSTRAPRLHGVMRPAVVLRTTGLTVSDRRGPTIAVKHHVSRVIEDIDVIVKPKDNVVRRTRRVRCVSTHVRVWCVHVRMW